MEDTALPPDFIHSQWINLREIAVKTQVHLACESGLHIFAFPGKVSSFLGISLSDATSWGFYMYLSRSPYQGKSENLKDTSPYSNSVLKCFYCYPSFSPFPWPLVLKLKDLLCHAPSKNGITPLSLLGHLSLDECAIPWEKERVRKFSVFLD